MSEQAINGFHTHELPGMRYGPPMKPDLERDLGEQPLAGLMDELELSAHDLVAASTEQLNHKMVARARKGRRLTSNVKNKVLAAMRAASGKELTMAQLFTY